MLESKKNICSFNGSPIIEYGHFRILVLGIKEFFQFLPFSTAEENIKGFIADLETIKGYQPKFQRFYSDGKPAILTPANREELTTNEWDWILGDNTAFLPTSRVHGSLQNDFFLELQELDNGKDDGPVLGEPIVSLKDYGLRNELFTITSK